MPEMVPIWEQLVELAGSGDLAARFLSLYRPPAYLTGAARRFGRDRNPSWSATTITALEPSKDSCSGQGGEGRRHGNERLSHRPA